MLKKYIIILLFLYPAVNFAQLSALVFNSESKIAIPYVSIRVEGSEHMGTYTDENGKFIWNTVLHQEHLIFSSVGYEKKVVEIKKISDTVFLKPKIINLSEILILKRKNKKSIKIGNIDGVVSQISDFTKIPNGGLYSVAKYFSADKVYDEMPFLKKIKLRTHSETKDAFFYIRLYSKGDNGEPDGLLYDQDIIGEVKRGHDRILAIEVSKLNIVLPSSGFYVAVGRMIPDEEKRILKDGSIVSSKTTSGPGLIKLKDRAANDTWMTNKGIWKQWKNFSAAIELEMSN